MELAAELRRALASVSSAGAPEVRENGEWLAALDGLQYEVRAQGESALLHMWSARQNLVRRVVRVAEESSERVVVEVLRFGHARNTRLEFVAASPVREARRVDRSQFGDRLRQILTDRFPDETVDSLVTSADLRHSLSGSYTRGLVHRGSEAIAVLGASPNEESATLDGILTFGLIWLQHARDRAKRCKERAGMHMNEIGDDFSVVRMGETLFELGPEPQSETRSEQSLNERRFDIPRLVKAALQAAAHPAKTDFLFYVTDPNSCNELTFAKTEDEFFADAAKYEKAREKNGGNQPSTCK